MNLYNSEIFATGFRHGKRVMVEELDAVAEASRLIGPVPIKIQHQPASGFEFGRVENLRREGEVLLADLTDVPDHLPERYRYCSAETLTPFRVNGRTFARGLTAVSLTDRPGCYGLRDLFGNQTDELCVRPTGEFGFESFKLEDEQALFVAETLIPNESGTEWELEAEARGNGSLSIGFVGHNEDGNMQETLYRAAGGKLDGETRKFSGRVVGRDFPMIAPAFEARTSQRMEVDYLRIRRVS